MSAGPEIDPLAARVFVRKFPGVDLHRLKLEPVWPDKVFLEIEGSVETVLEYGLAEPHMIPPQTQTTR